VITNAVRPPGEDADVPTFCRAPGASPTGGRAQAFPPSGLDVGALHQLAALIGCLQPIAYPDPSLRSGGSAVVLVPVAVQVRAAFFYPVVTVFEVEGV